MIKSSAQVSQVALFFVAFFFVAGIGLLSIIHSVDNLPSLVVHIANRFLYPQTFGMLQNNFIWHAVNKLILQKKITICIFLQVLLDEFINAGRRSTNYCTTLLKGLKLKKVQKHK